MLAGYARFEIDDDPQAGLDLVDAIFAEATSLRTLPHRFPIAAHESELFEMPLRRRNVGKWAMFYSIEENGEDGPLVTIIFLWPGSARPVTDELAERIKGNQ
jgi:hypothetical protein